MDDYTQLQAVIASRLNATPADLLLAVADHFYSLPSIFYRLLIKSGVGLWWNIPRNLGYRLALTQRRAVDFDGLAPVPFP